MLAEGRTGQQTDNMNLTIDEYRILVEQAPILIWRSDTTGACDYFNERWLEFRGRTLGEEYGDGWAQGVHPDDFDRCVRIYREAFAKRESFEMEYRLQRYDGQYRWITDRGAPFTLDDGSFGGYIGSCVDVNARVEAEQHLRRIREAEFAKLRRLLPICAACKRIRDDKGYWQQVEQYIHEQAGTAFTHGICPECMWKLYPEYADAAT
jgi:PAS domain S-box-containing protein